MQNVLACLVMIHYPSWLNKVYLSQYWTKKLLSSRWWLLQAEKNLSVKVKGLALLSYWLTKWSRFWLLALWSFRGWLHFIGYQMKGYLWGMLGTANQVCGCLLVFGNLLGFQQHTWMMWTLNDVNTWLSCVTCTASPVCHTLPVLR